MKESKLNFSSNVESAFYKISGAPEVTTEMPYVIVDNFPKMGLLTTLRFLEWTEENPDGVVSLPTGKTPEYFIKWTQYILESWESRKVTEIRQKYDLSTKKKPRLDGLHFIQIDEFYPVRSTQHNSFYHYVNKYYIRGFGLNREKALLINCDEIPIPENKHFSEVFPDNTIDLTLRYREPSSSFEELQQRTVFSIDNWCSEYEEKIREKGGIGFFLGGIGPDGHIAFNTRGSDHFSTTRLTSTNFQTQAVAAGDLGGIDVSRNRLVITIGLETITYNPDATAIIFAAGDAKANVVKQALEEKPSNLYPATALHRLKNARFYLTDGAASGLEDSIYRYYTESEWNHIKTERAVIDLCSRIDRYGHHLTLDDLKDDEYCRLIPGLNKNTVTSVTDSILKKFAKGMTGESNQTYYHTGPHHDDIMLGILPHIHRLLRNESNTAHFAILTSGFTAVTNSFVEKTLTDTKRFIEEGQIQMLKYPDFYDYGYKYKKDKDVNHYLNRVASGEDIQRRRGLSHRIVRALIEIYNVKNTDQLRDTINAALASVRRSYDGEKDHPDIQMLKGMIREFEEELVWAHFGIKAENVHHLRLGFYTGDIFTEQPEKERDIMPVLEELRKYKPTVLSLALDPEGSGPDTHYKVLQTIAGAVRLWREEEDLSNFRIWGYRNVWYRFHPAEADVIVPVSLNAMAVMDNAFTSCYLSQVDAPFPAYLYDGKFSSLAVKIWVEQLRKIQLLLGKDFFYQHTSPWIRSTHGLLFFKEMNVDKFLNQAGALEKSMEGMI